uniref:NADH-ubiquinone oxidoreductase chain 2 n=1 Tax=Utterbackia peninsularis TaxID=872316 RepID=F4ZG73_9BIVA|nr:NADH dehydrogenase subunit 2 [Utterbackia peninsularis]ADL62597.1 NADH dehydrogenase subunit 2 [Utterbackia peninsularis]
MEAKTPLFSMLLMTSTLLVVAASNYMFAWMMMELNMLTFTPLMCSKKSSSAIETSIKYLIPQSFASSLFILAISMTTFLPNHNMLTTTALLMKLGSAPFHTWFPTVMMSINLVAGFILMTWQKIIPLTLMSIPQLSHTPLILVSAAVTALWGSIAGLNQTNTTLMLAFSSVAHLAWMISATLFSVSVTLLYFTLYTLTLLTIFNLMNTQNLMSHKMFMHTMLNPNHLMIFVLNFLSLAGMPPFAMFSGKLVIVYLMKNMMTTLVIMLISAAISLYFYMVITFTSFLNSMNSLSLLNKMLHFSAINIMTLVLQLSALPLTLYLTIE